MVAALRDIEWMLWERQLRFGTQHLLKNVTKVFALLTRKACHQLGIHFFDDPEKRLT